MGNKRLVPAIQVTAITMAVIQIVYVFYSITSFSRFAIIHVMFAVALVMMAKISEASSRRNQALFSLLFVISLASLLYVFFQAGRLELQFGKGLPAIDFWVGAVVVGVFVIIAYLTWGPIIPIIVLISLLYFFFGHNISGILGFPSMGKDHVMTYLAMGISTGVFGYLLPVSASLIFYFMLFSGVMDAVGILPMFLEIGKLLGRLLRGGAAFTAIIGSSLVGTVTGSTTANVAMTGMYTIPTMKSQGFKPDFAAAVEQVSSCGGQLMPPIMGTGAFLMASFLGMPYWNIALAALLPAIAYYIITITGVMINIRHSNIRPGKDEIDKKILLSRLPLFLIPLGILIIFLSMGISPSRTAVYAIASITGIAVLYRILGLAGIKYFSDMPILTLKGFCTGLARGARQGAELAIIIVAVSIIAQAAITTGLGPKLGHFLIELVGDYGPLALIMVMFACLVLGMGVPTVAAYSIVAIVMVPTLTMSMGIDRLSAHFFAFYFAIFGAVTPPVASAALVASKLANCSYWSAGLAGFRLAFPLFLIPFALTSEPQLLHFPNIGFGGLIMLLAILISGFGLSIATYKHFLVELKLSELLLIVLALGLIISFILFLKNYWFLIGSLAILAIVFISQFRSWRQTNTQHRRLEVGAIHG